MAHNTDILTALRNNGRRITAVRTAVIDLFTSRHVPMSAADVRAHLARNGIRPNATTVYRELQFLAEEGILTTVHFQDGVTRYELGSLPHHHHLVCTSCNGVTDVHMESDLHAVERKIARSTGFAVAHHALEFYGTCRRCR